MLLLFRGLPAQCERYWPGIPDGKTMRQHGDIRILTLKSTPRRGYVRSTIKVTDAVTACCDGVL